VKAYLFFSCATTIFLLEVCLYNFKGDCVLEYQHPKDRDRKIHQNFGIYKYLIVDMVSWLRRLSLQQFTHSGP